MTMRATAHQSWARAGARHSLRGRAKTDGLALPTDERAIQGLQCLRMRRLLALG